MVASGAAWVECALFVIFYALHIFLFDHMSFYIYQEVNNQTPLATVACPFLVCLAFPRCVEHPLSPGAL